MAIHYTTEALQDIGAPQLASMLVKNLKGGKLPFNFTVPAATVKVKGTDTLILRRLPAGNVYFFPKDSYIQWTAGGSSQTFDVGYESYLGYDGVAVAEDDNLFDDAVDANAAGEALLGSDYGIAVTTTGTGMYKLFQSKGGVNILWTCEVAAFPAAATIKGYLQIDTI